MRTLFDTDEEEMEGKASEITLSTAARERRRQPWCHVRPQGTVAKEMRPLW
jgi:hypothetical protein